MAQTYYNKQPWTSTPKPGAYTVNTGQTINIVLYLC